MKLLVISDTHGRASRILEVLDMHPTYDAMLFLGDGLRDLEWASDNIHGLFTVRGNCDGMSFFDLSEDAPKDELFIRFDEYNILMTHGHRFGVKGGVGTAAAYAASKGADILIYGHTHTPEERYIPEGEAIGDTVLKKPLRIFNPGSLGSPREGYPSYGIIDIRGSSVLMSVGYIK